MKVIFLSLVGVFVLLVGFAVLNGGIFSRSSHSPITAADSDLHVIGAVLEQYREIGACYPSNEQGLMALAKRPEMEPFPLRWVQTCDELPTDPWNTPFQYHYPGRVNPEKPEIVSAGPDREFGTEDDLSSQD